MKADEIQALVEVALAQIQDRKVRHDVQAALCEPKKQIRNFEWERSNTVYSSWLIALIKDDVRGVGISYAEGGFAEIGSPWGLVFVSDSHTGPPNSWYSSLVHLVDDSGHFD